MKHGSLFSGIGGFDLAAEWMGWENIFHCEFNEFGKRVLKYYWPNAISYDDIKQTNFTIHRGQIDVLSGGFPCQPFSQAGKRKGTEDDRHLWPEMLRAVREIQPPWIVGENVRGLLNWDGGVVFEQVQVDLETEGYEVTSFLLPACAVNAPHRRDRIWFIAHNNRNGQHRRNGKYEIDTSEGREHALNDNDIEPVVIADSSGQRLQRGFKAIKGREMEKQFGRLHSNNNQFEGFPTQPPICSGNDGLPGQLDGITFSKWRNESIKAYGNAVVPHLVFQIFKAIDSLK